MALLMQEKNCWTKKRNHPPVYIKTDLQSFDLASLGKFDVIYCDPPWEEYERKAKIMDILNENPKYYKCTVALTQPWP
jgi:16S rRNA G966 N2-methylase RsmD